MGPYVDDVTVQISDWPEARTSTGLSADHLPSESTRELLHPKASTHHQQGLFSLLPSGRVTEALSPRPPDYRTPSSLPSAARSLFYLITVPTVYIFTFLHMITAKFSDLSGFIIIVIAAAFSFVSHVPGVKVLYFVFCIFQMCT